MQSRAQAWGPASIGVGNPAPGAEDSSRTLRPPPAALLRGRRESDPALMSLSFADGTSPGQVGASVDARSDAAAGRRRDRSEYERGSPQAAPVGSAPLASPQAGVQRPMSAGDALGRRRSRPVLDADAGVAGVVGMEGAVAGHDDDLDDTALLGLENDAALLTLGPQFGRAPFPQQAQHGAQFAGAPLYPRFLRRPPPHGVQSTASSGTGPARRGQGSVSAAAYNADGGGVSKPQVTWAAHLTAEPAPASAVPSAVASAAALAAALAPGPAISAATATTAALQEQRRVHSEQVRALLKSNELLKREVVRARLEQRDNVRVRIIKALKAQLIEHQSLISAYRDRLQALGVGKAELAAISQVSVAFPSAVKPAVVDALEARLEKAQGDNKKLVEERKLLRAALHALCGGATSPALERAGGVAAVLAGTSAVSSSPSSASAAAAGGGAEDLESGERGGAGARAGDGQALVSAADRAHMLELTLKVAELQDELAAAADAITQRDDSLDQQRRLLAEALQQAAASKGVESALARAEAERQASTEDSERIRRRLLVSVAAEERLATEVRSLRARFDNLPSTDPRDAEARAMRASLAEQLHAVEAIARKGPHDGLGVRRDARGAREGEGQGEGVGSARGAAGASEEVTALQAEVRTLRGLLRRHSPEEAVTLAATCSRLQASVKSLQIQVLWRDVSLGRFSVWNYPLYTL